MSSQNTSPFQSLSRVSAQPRRPAKFAVAASSGRSGRIGVAQIPDRPIVSAREHGRSARVETADGARQLAMMKWRLISSWADDPKIGYSLINARSETAAVKPSFRAAMNSRRCLIPAHGSYEWRKAGKKGQPIYLR